MCISFMHARIKILIISCSGLHVFQLPWDTATVTFYSQTFSQFKACILKGLWKAEVWMDHKTHNCKMWEQLSCTISCYYFFGHCSAQPCCPENKHRLSAGALQSNCHSICFKRSGRSHESCNQVVAHWVWKAQSHLNRAAQLYCDIQSIHNFFQHPLRLPSNPRQGLQESLSSIMKVRRPISLGDSKSKGCGQ